MGKKLQWIYLGIYTLTILYLLLSSVIQGDVETSILNNLLSFVLFMLPAGVIVLELRGKKVPSLITLVMFLFVLIMLIGTLNFNSLALDTVFKAIVFGVMVILLAYYVYKRIFRKKQVQ